MNLRKLHDEVSRLVKLAETQNKDPENINVGIKVHRLGAIGPTPIVDVNSIFLGFDWDNNKCIIEPEKVLKEADSDELEKLRKAFNKLGWMQYEHKKDKKWDYITNLIGDDNKDV